jgi:perosamine synthetase
MNDPKENLNPNLKVPLAKPWFGDEEPQVAYDIVKSKWLIFGPQTKKFEREFAKKIGVKYAIAVNSGSSALLVAQEAIGVLRGDEIIVPDMTFVSTATSSMYLGARPVFSDINLSTYCVDPSDTEKKITDKTKAIIPVHYAGQSADMDEIKEIAREHDLFVIEDAAEAHLSEYKGKKVGNLGDAAIFSFTPSKPMTTGEGGMVTTNNEEIAERARLIRNFGDVDKFKWNYLGFNFRMPEVMGGIGRIQLKKLESAIDLRKKIAKQYNEEFEKISGIITPFVRNENDINYQLYTIRIDEKHLQMSGHEFIVALNKLRVSSRLYYPSLHNQKVFRDLPRYKDEEFPNTMKYCESALSLPIFPSMSSEDIHHVIDCVKTISKKRGK